MNKKISPEFQQTNKFLKDMDRFKSDKHLYRDIKNIINALLNNLKHKDIDNFFIVLKAFIKNSNNTKQ